MGIRTKINLVLFLVFGGGLIVTGIQLENTLLGKARQEVEQSARMLLLAANQIERHKPLSSNTSEQGVQKLLAVYPGALYTTAELKAHNIKNQGADWQKSVLDSFIQNPTKKLISGTHHSSGVEMFYLASPVASLPGSGRNTEGKSEIVGARFISLPLQLPLSRAKETVMTLLFVIVSLFVVVFLALNLLLYFLVIRKIRSFAVIAGKVSKNDMSVAEIKLRGKDELSDLGHSFNLMYRSLISALKLLDKTILNKHESSQTAQQDRKV